MSLAKIILMMVSLLICCELIALGSSNYLQNAGFEEAGSSDETAAYWERGHPDNNGYYIGNVARRNWRSKSGSWEGVIMGRWADTNNDGGGIYRGIPIEGGQDYTFGGWFWSDDNANNEFTAGYMGMSICYYTNSPDPENMLTYEDLYFDKIGSIWTYQELTFTAPVEAEWASVEIFAGDTGYNGALQFDDLFFGVKDPEPPKNPGPMCRRTPLVISEIMYHPKEGEEAPEFVELFNSEPFSHDLSGFSLAGDIEFTFPDGCVVGPTGYVVVASSPDAMQSFYSITNALGPFTDDLPDSGGELKLLNELGAELMTVEYDDEWPWPPEADGLGYALVPDEESYGPNDVRSWKGGCYCYGSPGYIDPVSTDAVMSVVINEVLTHTDPPLSDYLELYNSSDSVINLAGCILTDSKTNDLFVMPEGTIIQPHGYLAFETNTMHFNLSSYGETVYFKTPGGTGMIDVIEFPGLPNGISYGRWPDGRNLYGMLESLSKEASNTAFSAGDIVVNEIMYNPLSGSDDDEYIELYNRGNACVDISGWRIRGGIDFVFPQGTEIATGAYLVVANKKENLIAKYDQLDAFNTVGDYGGKLSDHSDRILLEALDDPEDPAQAWVVMDDVTYFDGGAWGQWSDGGGSSLELIDPHSDNRLPSNWTDSDETEKGTWTTNSITRVLANGMLPSDTDISQVQMMLLRKGECLVDDVCVTKNPGNNLVENPGFEDGSEHWYKRGNHKYSATTSFAAASGSRSECLRASGGGDTKGNGLAGDLKEELEEGDHVTMSAKVRWMRGEPYFHLRLMGGYLSQTTRLPTPETLGTPGMQNSAHQSNIGPAITDVSHAPLLPMAYEDVTITASVNDPDGVSSVILYYRDDPGGATYSASLMTLTGNGTYSTTIDGSSAGAVTAFFVQAMDRNSNKSRYPADAPDSECLIRFAEANAGAQLGAYHIITTEETMNTWRNRSSLDNSLLDCTFISGNRVIYNAGIRYRGSPFLRRMESWMNDPANASAAYRVEFPSDTPYLDSTEINLDWQETGRDTTYQRERTAFWIARKAGLPAINQRYVVVYINGKKRGVIYTDSQHIDSDYVTSWYPDRPEGDLHKINDWVEYDEDMDQSNFASKDGNLVDYTVNGQRDVERYRWNWERMKCGTYDSDYGPVMTLVDAANLPSEITAAMEAVIDVRQWMKTIALRHVVDDWDSFGFDRGKNMFSYRPEEGKWDLLLWDIDFGFGASSGNDPTTDVFKVDYRAMPLMHDLLNDNYTFRHYYWQALKQITEGPLSDPALNNMIIEIQEQLQHCGITELYGKTDLMAWIEGRRDYLREQMSVLTNIDLMVYGSYDGYSNNTVMVYGTAPIQMNTLKANDVPCHIDWLNDYEWIIELAVTNTPQTFSLQGYDQNGLPIADLSDVYEYTNSITEELLQDSIVINEIMYNPAPGGVAFIELYNRATNTVFDLYNCRMQGVDYTFEKQTLIYPGQYVAIASDRQRYVDLYGVTNIPVANWKGTLSNAGETLRLIQLDSGGQEIMLVDEVTYSDEPPWPAAADGAGSSLQLIDCEKDNNRVGNWDADTTVPVTPNAQNSVMADLPAFPLCFLNEVQPVNQTTIQDHAGDYDPWLELYNGSSNALDLKGYYLTDDYSQLNKWAFGDVSIQGCEFQVLWIDGEETETTENEIHTPFRLNETSGSLALVHAHDDRLIVVDYMNYRDVPRDRSYGDFTDGAWTNRMYFANGTPGYTNEGTPMPAMIVINEWLADNESILEDPQEPGKYEDWFELYNAGQVDIDLGGYGLTDDPDDPHQWIIPTNTILQSGDYRLVWADDDTEQNLGGTNDLHANFKLSASGEYIGLFNADGARVDAVQFGPQTTDVSEGCFPDAQRPFYTFTAPTPYARNLLSTNVYVITVMAGNHGRVTPSGGVEVLYGYDQEFAVTSEYYYVIDRILTNGCQAASATGSNACTLTLPFVTEDILLEVSYSALTSTNGTPVWWLAQYGLTNQPLDEAAASDTDTDGFSAADEYIAGTVPVSSQSFFEVSNIFPASNGEPIFEWSPSVSGRVYIINRKTDLTQPELQTVTNLHFPSSCYTAKTESATGFYQVGVELE